MSPCKKPSVWFCRRCGLRLYLSPDEHAGRPRACDVEVARLAMILRGWRPVGLNLIRLVIDADVPYERAAGGIYQSGGGTQIPVEREWVRLWVPARAADVIAWTASTADLHFPRPLRLRLLRSAMTSPEEFAAMSAAHALGGAVGLLGYAAGPRKRARGRSAR